MRPRVRVVVALYALLGLLVVPVFPHFSSPNELTRWAVAASVAEERTFEVSSVLPLLGNGFEDLSVANGRTYSNKAPGTLLAAFPGYLAARPFAGPPSPGSIRPVLTAMRLFGATLPALLLALLVVQAAERLGGEPSRLAFVAVVLLFGTPLFTYGLLLFSHALVALALFGAWVALFLPGRPASMGRREVLAGALIGLAVLSEYPAAVPGLVLVAAACLSRRAARVARICAGAAPFALLLALYDTVCFGGPFELSSGHEKLASFQTLADGGLFGISVPSPSIFLRLLADPAKGLFVFSPVLLLAVRALGAAWRVLPRDAFFPLVLVPLSLVLLYAGYPNWHGGWTVGSRYLVAALPFLVLPLAFRQGGALEAALTGASILAVAVSSLVFPCIPRDFPLPWGTLALPLLGRGLVAPNLLHLVWKGLALTVPFLLVAAASLAALPRARWLALATGATVSAAVALLLPAVKPLSPVLRLERGYVEEVYFERPGAMEREMPPGISVPASLLSRRDQALRLPPTSWPF